MSSLIEEQAPLDVEIADALICATPESWKSAVMTVDRAQEGDLEKMKILIFSPEGRTEVVSATDEIFAGLYKLSNLHQKYGSIWKQLRYSIEMEVDGDWKFSARFEY